MRKTSIAGALTVAALAAFGLSAPSTMAAAAPSPTNGVEVAWKVDSSWNAGFQASATVVNHTGSPPNPWTVDLAMGHPVSSLWDGVKTDIPGDSASLVRAGPARSLLAPARHSGLGCKGWHGGARPDQLCGCRHDLHTDRRSVPAPTPTPTTASPHRRRRPPPRPHTDADTDAHTNISLADPNSTGANLALAVVLKNSSDWGSDAPSTPPSRTPVQRRPRRGR